jgi:hypothetical protein
LRLESDDTVLKVAGSLVGADGSASGAHRSGSANNVVAIFGHTAPEIASVLQSAVRQLI